MWTRLRNLFLARSKHLSELPAPSLSVNKETRFDRVVTLESRLPIRDIRGFQEFVYATKAAREWHQYHQPKDLLLGIIEEIGEFRNLIKWEQDPEKIRAILVEHCSDERREKIVDFFGDMLWYTASLADYCQVDLRDAMQLIAEKHPARFPIEKVRGTTANPETGGYDGQYVTTATAV